ncbi:hypothetical protein KIN20_000554 [Parelaphostrongylus tenuis]|uniref:Uncharacterized protein n=1 Tax=Parelaphostrongylus tenuis TaxID=148309 RepID=A0AAD5LWA9_PARTN|nr:hypothetical protein KIN20_000554 [Parelaphostrongylus tenuis]
MNVEDVLNHLSVRVQDRKVVLRRLNDLVKDGSNQLVIQRRSAKYTAIEYDPKLTKEDKVPFIIE